MMQYNFLHFSSSHFRFSKNIKTKNYYDKHSPFVNETITGKQSAHVPHEMIKNKIGMNENYKESK